ncbi:MAG: hypothetical protein AB3N28_15260 [Kordiimonas sp.]
MRNTLFAITLVSFVPLAGCEMIEDRNCDTPVLVKDAYTGAQAKVRDLVSAGLTVQVQAMMPMSESLRTFHAHELLAIDNNIDRAALKRLESRITKLKCAKPAAQTAVEQIDALASFVAFRGRERERYAKPSDYVPFFDRALDAVEDYVRRTQPSNAVQTQLALKRIRENLSVLRQ